MKIRAIDKAIYKWLMSRLANDFGYGDETEDGGPGSGNWGHKGRPGERGGSGKGGGTQFRGGRGDMGNYYGSKHDWLNGLNGERQKQVTNMLKSHGGGDIKAGEKAIMQGKNASAKIDYLKAMSEARLLDKKKDYFMSELEDFEQETLKSLDEKYKGGFPENAPLIDRLKAVAMLGNEDDVRVYSDLLSKAMGGETSGQPIPKLSSGQQPPKGNGTPGSFGQLKKPTTQQEAVSYLKQAASIANDTATATQAMKDSKVFKKPEWTKLDGIAPGAAKKVLERTSQVIDKYPFMYQNIDWMNVEDLGGGTYANCRTGTMLRGFYGNPDMFIYGGGGVKLNPRYFGDEEKIKRSFESDLRTGFHPPETEYDSIVVHEMGHSVDGYLSQKTQKKASQELRRRVAKRMGLTVGRLASTVSGYATKNEREWFAESFAELHCSKSPRQSAVIFGEELEKYIKEAGL